jgi:hypothetical protein
MKLPSTNMRPTRFSSNMSMCIGPIVATALIAEVGDWKIRLGQRILECVFSIWTRSAQSIRASGHIGRINRPDT